jgi:hypothetical protein
MLTQGKSRTGSTSKVAVHHSQGNGSCYYHPSPLMDAFRLFRFEVLEMAHLRGRDCSASSTLCEKSYSSDHTLLHFTGEASSPEA